MRDSTVAGVLHVLFNGEALFRLVRDITGCGPIGNFRGRVYRMASHQGHHDAWHSDVGDHRMIGMSVNLGAQAFAGGMLQIRARDTQRLLCEVSNTGPGDALMFRLGPELQHRVTEVAGEFPKTAFAGWFRSTPGAREWLGIERSSTGDEAGARR